jgi:hypothetical protein
MKTTIRKFIGALLVLSVITLAISPAAAVRKSHKQKNAGVSDDIVLQWNEIAYRRLPAGPPTRQPDSWQPFNSPFSRRSTR